MSIANTIIRSSLFATLTLSMYAFADVPTPPPHQFGLKARGDDGQDESHVETCNNKASCSLIIAYCAGHCGDLEETGTPGTQGEPQKGKYTYL